MSIPLHELKRMMEAGTPGPWSYCDSEPVHGHPCMIRYAGGMLGHSPKESESPCGATLFRRSDAALIVAAINALPSLLAVVSAAQAMQRAGAVYGPFQEGDLERAFDGLDQALAPFQGKEK